MIRAILPSLEADEKPRTRACALGFGFVASAALVARSAGDALFLSTYPASWLGYMYLATAAVIGSVAFLFSVWASRISVDKLVLRSGVVLIVILLGLAAALQIGPASSWDELRIAAYVLGDLVVAVPMLLFWSFASMVFNPREAKRVFGVIGAAGTLGCIVVGFIVRPVAGAFGTPNLLILAALLLAGFVASAARLASREPERFHSSHTKAGPNPLHLSYYASLLRSPQVRSLVLLVVTATLTLTVVDFQFKAGSRAHYDGPQLAGFFGTFYAGASIMALLIQLFLVGPILQRGGVYAGLVILPIGLLATAAITFITGAFEWIVITKLTVQVCLFTIDIAALQMLYLGIARQSRSQARTFVEGMGKPLAMAAVGAALAGLAALVDLRWLGAFAACGAALWLLLTRSNHRAYVSALVDSLGARRLDFSSEANTFQDPQFTTHLKESLKSARDDEIPYMLGLLPAIEEVDWTAEYRSLLGRNNSEVKVACLRYLGEHGAEADIPSFVSHIAHADPEIRAEALRAVAGIGSRERAPDIEPSLEDAHPRVRAVAVSILINSGDLDLLLSAGAVLRDMLRSTEPADRTAAAEALADLKTRGLVRPIIGLLEDSEAGVRLAALEACRKRPDPQLISAVAPLLADPAIAPAAADTLVTFGSASLDHLTPYLDLSRMEGAFTGAHRVPGILARIGDPAALPHLLQASEQPDLALRSESIRAFASIVSAGSSSRHHRPDIERSARREVAAAAAAQASIDDLSSFPGTEVLLDALEESYRIHAENTFVLLDLVSPRVDMEALYQGIADRPGEEAANALEVLDNVLKGELRTDLVSLLERRLKPAPPSADAARSSSVIERLLSEDASDWVTIGALYGASENGIRSAAGDAKRYIAHTNPFVRETALHTLSRLDDEASVREAADRLSDDPDPGVSRLARELAA